MERKGTTGSLRRAPGAASLATRRGITTRVDTGVDGFAAPAGGRDAGRGRTAVAALRLLADPPAPRSRAQADTILGLMAALHAKDPYTARHSTRVAGLAHPLAMRLALPAREIEHIRLGAALHDIGKIGIPDALLTRPGSLSAREFACMQHHPALGVDILEPIGFLGPILPLVRHHHEWFDGTGYPDGLHGDDIPFGAAVIQMADSIDAMRSPRSYKPAFGLAEVIGEIERGDGTQFNPRVARAAVQWLKQDLRERPPTSR